MSTITTDDLLVIKHTLEDSIAAKRDAVLAREYYREPVVDMQRVLEKVHRLVEIEAGYENGAN